jgi:hypothetical protein
MFFILNDTYMLFRYLRYYLDLYGKSNRANTNIYMKLFCHIILNWDFFSSWFCLIEGKTLYNLFQGNCIDLYIWCNLHVCIKASPISKCYKLLRTEQPNCQWGSAKLHLQSKQGNTIYLFIKPVARSNLSFS